MAESPIYIRARARAISVTLGTLQRKKFRDEYGDVIFHMSSIISHPTTRTRQHLLVKETANVMRPRHTSSWLSNNSLDQDVNLQ
jgi:hypothetical protein